MPVQAVVATITSEAEDYAVSVVQRLRAAGPRVESDLRNEKVCYKVREDCKRRSQATCCVAATA